MLLYLLEPNNRMSNGISSFSFFKEASILKKPFRSFCLFSAKIVQRKKEWSDLWNHGEIYVRLNDWILTVALSSKKILLFQIKRFLKHRLKIFDTFSFSQGFLKFLLFINTEREKRLFEVFSSCPKPSNMVV